MPEQTRQQQRDRVRQRIRAAVDPENYEYTPEKHQTDHVRADEFQRVAIYARVSTSDPNQTSSFELQQKYYQDLVGRYPKWKLVKIYADEGKSGVTIQHRAGFLEMMDDAFAGRIDLIIVKNISRLARNVVDFLSTIRKLSEKKVGVLFESEAIYSLNPNSHLALSFQATIAEEESRIRSRSMESSLRMRLDHGLPLTPELLGFMHDENGKLVINPETYKIPKLMFFMYLYGYSTKQIAEILIRLSKKSYLGNIKWSASGVADTLKNERYCGDVRTRKRFKLFAADVTSQKTFTNRGEKPQSYYKNEHDAIISRDDYLAVQRIMSNAKYGGTSLLPSLQVIPEGLLKGFVVVHPRWGSFQKNDYLQASKSVDPPDERWKEEKVMAAQKGDFDLRGYEVADFKLFDDRQVPSVSFQKSDVRFSLSCIRRMNCGNHVELLVHPTKKQIAVRPSAADLVAEDVLFTVKDTGVEQKVEMKDDYTKVEITKSDITDGKPVIGAKLTIFDQDGKEVESWVTEEKPHYIEKLPVGDYTLREVTAPDGYLKTEDVKFSVKDTGEIQKVAMKDDYTKVEISKQDITNSKEIPGAKLTIFDKDGKEVESWVSEEKPHYIEKLPVGEYTLREVTAPDGYEVAEDVKFTVAETGEIQTVVMKDKPKKQPETTPATEKPTTPDNPTNPTSPSTPTTSKETPKETPTTPKTGDDRNPLIWLLLLGIGGCMAGAAWYLRKKDEKDQNQD